MQAIKQWTLIPFVASCGFIYGNELNVWEWPQGGARTPRQQWAPAKPSSPLRKGAIVETGPLVAHIESGKSTISLTHSDTELSVTAELRFLTPHGVVPRVERIQLRKRDGEEAIVSAAWSGGEVALRFPNRQPFVEIRPGPEMLKGTLEISTKSAYLICPDFFGNDIVVVPERHRSESVTLPAENFLLHLVEGGHGLIMCVWQGTLSLGKTEPQEAREPRVDVFLSGHPPERRADRTRIEFAGKPIFVAILAAKAIWHDRDVRGEPAQKPVALDWQRPFEAKWRVDFTLREGTYCHDMMTDLLSWDAVYTAEWTGKKEADGSPTMSLQGLWPYFLIPAWIRNDTKGDNRFYIALYADMNKRKAVEAHNKKLRASAKQTKTPFVPVYPTNVFEQVVVYPLDRRKDTPLQVLTPVDIMRETLGQGPCQYILDLEGIRPMASGGVREIEATCGTYDNYLSRFVAAIEGRSAWLRLKSGQSVKLDSLKSGERFKPEHEAILIEKLEDLVLFVTAVIGRLRQYNKFHDDLLALCAQVSGQGDEAKAFAARIAERATILGKRCSKATLNQMANKRDEWANQIGQIIEEVKNGTYTNLKKSGNIRPYAESQDILVSFCRRAVKAIRQEAAFPRSSNPEVLRFAANVREMCHQVLRNKHPMEGW